jgi:hypothetical protein
MGGIAVNRANGIPMSIGNKDRVRVTGYLRDGAY